LPLFGDERITGDAEVGIFNKPLGGPNPLAPIIAKSSEIVERFLFYARDMTIRRMDNIGAVVDDLAAAIASLSKLVWSWRARRQSRDVGRTASSGLTASASTSP